MNGKGHVTDGVAILWAMLPYDRQGNAPWAKQRPMTGHSVSIQLQWIAFARLFLFARLSDFWAIGKYTSREPRHLPIRAASGVDGNRHGEKENTNERDKIQG